VGDRFEDMTAVQVPRDTHQALKLEAIRHNIPLYELVDLYLRRALLQNGVTVE
jgi:predicted glycosyltransferase